MTRWKTQPTVSLRLMHAHNVRSRWHDYVLDAATDLGLLVGYREYANWGDGSRDREWYVMTSQLESIGGMSAVLDLANDRQQADYR